MTSYQLMACENGGDFQYMPATGAVRRLTPMYLERLSVPHKKDDPMRARWTSSYPDAITGRSTISASLPAFRTDVNGEKIFIGERYGC